jgi:hypothetical protein
MYRSSGIFAFLPPWWINIATPHHPGAARDRPLCGWSKMIAVAIGRLAVDHRREKGATAPAMSGNLCVQS